ncbi:MAG TPA: hypothetical protein VFV19_08565 [Candidatus Polarisedimenticolaceae bacterium]|nr:hypothetical protein [Candidatus Polarisedimenticolaceae bacterium]
MRTFLAGAVLAAAASLAAYAGDAATASPDETYQCKDASGAIVLQNDPCDMAPARKKKVAEPAAPPEAKVKPKVTAKAAAPVRPKAMPASFTPPPVPRATSSSLGKPIRPVINPSVFTSDPRWGSPERTLKTFVGAMKGGDRALAQQCLAAGTAGDLDRMRDMVEAFSGYVLEGEVGSYWSIRALRARTRPKWIFFTRAADGTWRIAAL